MEQRSIKKIINKIRESDWYYCIMFWTIGMLFLLVVEILYCCCYLH